MEVRGGKYWTFTGVGSGDGRLMGIELLRR
jgi:hypothetical protein